MMDLEDIELLSELKLIEEDESLLKIKIKRDMMNLNKIKAKKKELLLQINKRTSVIINDKMAHIMFRFKHWYSYSKKEDLDCLPKKGLILDLIKSHQLQDGYAYNISEFLNFNPNDSLENLKKHYDSQEDKVKFTSLLEDLMNQNFLLFVVEE